MKRNQVSYTIRLAGANSSLPSDLGTNRGSFGQLLWFGLVLSATIPWWVHGSEVVVPLYATSRLLAVHLIAAIPLGVVLAIQYPIADRISWRGGLALLLACIASGSLEVLSGFMRSLDTGLWERWLVRNGLALGFAFLLLSSGQMVGWWSSFRERARGQKTEFLLGALLVWVVLPGVYAWKQDQTFREDFKSKQSSMRMVQALQSLQRIIELRGHGMIDDQSTGQWERRLRREIRQLEAELETSISPSDIESGLRQSMRLLSLSRPAEALALLTQLSKTEPQVHLLSAIASRELQDWKGTERYCSEYMAISSEPNPLLYQLYGESLIGQGAISMAIECYRRAAVDCVSQQGEFEMRIGNLLSERGDKVGAAEHFQKAIDADPQKRDEATRRIRSLQSWSCRIGNS